jgi:hypothetical protein
MQWGDQLCDMARSYAANECLQGEDEWKAALSKQEENMPNRQWR